ncbi:MAG TPA: hypothetical protein VD772_11250 [Anseongella sp.]|nr:hypothetical protein [Anseongella sp.]
MGDSTITKDPAALAFLFTEELYAIREKPGSRTALRPERQAEKGPARMAEQPEKGTGELSAPESGPDGPQKLPPQEEVFHYLGENRRFVLVLVSYPGEEYLPAAEKAYLEKVLGAVNLNLEDIALLNYARYADRKYAELKAFFAFAGLLLFGVAPQQLQIPGPVLPYHLGLVENVKILAADSPEVFRPDPAKKKQLWAELKRIFIKP